MKTPRSTTKSVLCTLLLGVALLASGCGNSAQKKAYEHAAQMDQGFTAETAPAIITEYRKVIAIEPGTDWATKAAKRIEAVEARVKAAEQHKEVFQEHGID